MATVASEIRALPSDETVSGAIPLATLRVSPEELTSRIAVDWIGGRDELGELRSSVFETGPGNARFVLLSYEEIDPPEITLFGEPGSAELLDEVLRSLRVTERELVDRVDRRHEGFAAQPVNRDLVTAMEKSLRALQAQIGELQTEREIARLASLASIEQAELTPRQREVLQLMVSGFSLEEAADELGLSRSTVVAHLRAVRNALVHRR